MDARRIQGLLFLLSTAGVGMFGCDPAPEPPEDGPETEGDASSGSGGSDSPMPEGSACERLVALNIDCFPVDYTLEEGIEDCEELISYFADVSQECGDTFVEYADCLSRLECADMGNGCIEEAEAYQSLQCMGF